MKFGDDMKPYLLQLLDKDYGYTRITMRQIFPLSSSYAWRLVELLIQYRGFARKNGTGIIERKFTVEELRNVLDVPDGAYDRIAHFRSRVLDGPIREINKKTNYIMSYESIKEGRRIVAFLIRMDISNVPEDMTDDTKTYEASEKDYTYVKYPSQKKRTEEKPIMRPEPVQHVPSDGSLRRELERQGYHSPHMENLFGSKSEKSAAAE
jgi:plasmid replication initiation protein